MATVTSEQIEQVIEIAKKIAKDNLNSSYGPAHLLKALLNPQFDFLKELDSKGVDVFYLDEWAEIKIDDYKKASKPSDEPFADDQTITVLEEADNFATKFGTDVNMSVLLITIITPGIGFNHDQLKSLPLKSTELTSLLIEGKGSGTQNTTSTNNGMLQPNKSTSVLGKYCIDKLKVFQNKKQVHIIGRDEEIKTISEVLNRKLKPHIVITGDAGVGKTALIEGFCFKIFNKSSLSTFHGASVYELNLGGLFAGASYKGEVEDRLQKIFNELKQFEKPILIIDDIHELFDTNQGSGIGSVVKSELSKGDITFIGATTVDKLRKSLGKDDALSRRFENLEIQEPTLDLAFRMIDSTIENYSKHHNFEISESGIKEAIRLSKRYLKEKSLPDSALDLIDRTMSSLKVAKETLKKELPEIKTAFTALDLKQEDVLTELDWFHSDIIKKTGNLFQEVDESIANYAKTKTVDDKVAEINSLIAKLEVIEKQNNEVENSHLSQVVSGITGIPAGKVKSDEKEKLLDIENTLKKRVIGQDHAVKVVSDAILESRSGLTKPGQPIGSFFFLGPTGTGKTELAKSMADFLFGDENAIIRLDMSEFKEEHSAALLYGAPPGYVGYEEGGLLVNKIRQKPYSIVLFDEIEKAHKSVFDVFLQILDEGKLHDRLGKEGDFSNSVILFTSNIGSDFIVNSFEEGTIPKSNDLIQIMANYFRPEFLGRLTEVIPFAPINVNSVVTIFNIHLKKELVQLLDKLEISLELDSENAEKIAMYGFNPKYGARPIKGNIRNMLKRPLSRFIIADKIKKGDTIKVTMNESEEIEFVNVNEGSVL